jgi:hypothetical protein
MTTWTGWVRGFGVAVLGLVAASCGGDEPGRSDATDGVDGADGVDGVDPDTSEAEISEGDADVGSDGVEVGSDAADVRVGFAFEKVEVSGGTAVWGAVAVGGWLIGGVNNGQTVVSDIAAATLEDGTLTVARVGELNVPRYCQCVMFDAARGELVVVGGRGRTFADVSSAVVVDTASWDVTPLAGNTADDFPVGCAAFFSAVNDRGYVFGGLSSSRREFTGVTHRWEPESRTFEALDVAGPEPRYDPAVHVLDDGDALLVSGMGNAGTVVFYQDVWRFDAALETWTELEPTTAVVPPGRRLAWTAVAPDESLLVFGYGSDAPNGSSVLADLWTFDLVTRVWAPLEVEGEWPSARGFAPNWQLPAFDGVGNDIVGMLGFGTDAALQVTGDVFVLRAPDALRGRWH